jgi:hypothetical protein
LAKKFFDVENELGKKASPPKIWRKKRTGQKGVAAVEG